MNSKLQKIIDELRNGVALPTPLEWRCDIQQSIRAEGEGEAETVAGAAAGDDTAAGGQGDDTIAGGATPEKTPWQTRRIDELTRKLRDEERSHGTTKSEIAASKARVAELETQLAAAAKGEKIIEKVVDEEEVERRASAKAELRATELLRTAEFNKGANEIHSAGVKEYGEAEFGDAVKQFDKLGQGFRGTPAFVGLVEAAMEIGDGHRILFALGNDLDEASRILGLSPARQATALAKLAATAPEGRQETRAPAPPKGGIRVRGKSEPSLDNDELSDREWIALREKQLAKAQTTH